MKINPNPRVPGAASSNTGDTPDMDMDIGGTVPVNPAPVGIGGVVIMTDSNGTPLCPVRGCHGRPFQCRFKPCRLQTDKLYG